MSTPKGSILANPLTAAVAALLWLLPLGRPPEAADYFVNHEIGDDQFDGLAATVEAAPRGPVRTILRAIKAAGPGDTVHLAPTATPYPESVMLYTHPTWYHPGGEADKPLVIDGHGATVTGADPCPAPGWTVWRDRVYRRDDFPTTGGLMVDGARVHGLAPTVALAPGDWFYFPAFKHLYWRPAATLIGEVRLLYPEAEPESIEPKRWGQAGAPGVVRLVGVPAPTAIEVGGHAQPPVTLKERLQAGQWTNEGGVLYYHLPEGKSFADLEIACVVRQNGVQIGGSTSHVIVRNLHATRFANDGYNIHGGAHHLRFENIVATFCFDEGYSAHSDTDCEIDGATLLFNASGLTNVMRARTRAKNLLIAYNDGIGYAGLGETVEEVENLILIDNGSQLGGGRITARNVLSIATGKRPGSMQFSGEGTLERLTVIGKHGLRVNAQAILAIRDSIFAGQADWHFRADDPEKRLPTVERLVVDPALTISYGSRYPWTAMPLATWLDQHHPGQAGTAELPAADSFIQTGLTGQLPPGLGCSPDLLEKAAVFLRTPANRN